MSELTEQLDTMIQKAALDGALTKDAVKQFHELVEMGESLAEISLSQSREITDLKKRLTVANSKLDVANGLVKLAGEAELKMIEREAKITTLELTAKHEAVRVADHKEMFLTVFRNSVLRREVMTPIPGSSGVDQYNNPMPGGFVSKDTIEEEEV